MRHCLLRHSLRAPAMTLVSLGLLFTVTVAATAAPDGSVVRLPIKTAAFTGVALKGAMDITITQASATSVVASGTEAALAGLKVTVKDGVLHLEQENRRVFGRRDSLDIAIAMPDLRSVALSGSGDVIVSNMKLDKVALNVSGAGDVTASGSCNHLEARVAGAGDVAARNLKCRTVAAQVSGAGDIAIHVDQAVSAQVTGVGDIRIYGNPEQRSAITRGVGDITFHETAQ